MKNWQTWLLIVAGLLLAGCAGQNKADTDAAVRKAIEEHLASRPGLSSSEIVLEMKKVDIQGDKAEADVVFRSRNDSKASMDFHYQLRKDGSRWKVEPAGPNAGSSPHSSMPPSSMPPSEGAPSDQAPSGSASPLPQGHPPIGNPEQGAGKK